MEEGLNFQGPIGEDGLIQEMATQFSHNCKADVYNVYFAGIFSDEKHYVEVEFNHYGWGSEWPKWAFDLALEALINKKQLWIISDGDPFGNNLKKVFIRSYLI